jgi:hypothetical protein
MFPEKRIWSWLKADAPPGVLLQRIECNYPPGVPDVICCYLGVVTLIELKRIVKGRMKFSPGQRLFINRWVGHRGRAYVLGADEKKDLYLLEPSIILLSSGRLDQRDIVSMWPGGKINWQDMGRYIK